MRIVQISDTHGLHHRLGTLPEGDVLINWGNLAILKRIRETSPRYHLFGHSHESHGVLSLNGTVFSNGSLLDDMGKITYKPAVFEVHKQ